MSKLIAAFRADNSQKNAEKLRAYLRKHPFAVCVASADERVVLNLLNIR